MFEAQEIASQVEKHKQLIKKYKFDGSKILISGGTGIPVLIDVFINSLFKISISNEDKILKLLTDDSSQNVNPVQNSSSNQSVGECLNPNKDKSDNIISGFKFGNATLDKKSPGISLQSGATSESSADIKFGQTTKKADSTNPASGIETEFAGQTVSTVKTTTTETYTGKPPIVGGYKFEKLPESDKKYPTSEAVKTEFAGQTVSTVKTTTTETYNGKPPIVGGYKFEKLPESDKKYPTSEAVSLYPIVSSTFDKKTKPIKPDQSTIKFNKCTLSDFTIQQTAKPSGFTIQQTAKPSGFTIQQTAKPSGFTIQQTAKQFGFSFGGETITSKPASSFTFKSSVPISTASPAPADTEITNKTVASKAITFLGFSSSIIQPEHAKKDEKKVFGNHSNPKEGVWNCNGCLMSNKCDALKCPASGTLKPGVIKEGIKVAGHPQKKDGENGFGDYLFKHQD
ncbi:hypothetical protein AM593_09100, partial [Mytilus galloprovincialis]